MFRHMCTIFRENKLLVLKTNCQWKAVICKVLRSVATSLLKVENSDFYWENLKIFKTEMYV